MLEYLIQNLPESLNFSPRNHRRDNLDLENCGKILISDLSTRKEEYYNRSPKSGLVSSFTCDIDSGNHSLTALRLNTFLLEFWPIKCISRQNHSFISMECHLVL